MIQLDRLLAVTPLHIRPTWRKAWQEKESALRQRYHRTSESLREHSQPLRPLAVGDRCYVQNQTGNFPRRWDRSGTVVEDLGHDSYNVKIDGSGRLTRRNRQFLRKFTAPTLHVDLPGTMPRPPPQVTNDLATKFDEFHSRSSSSPVAVGQAMGDFEDTLPVPTVSVPPAVLSETTPSTDNLRVPDPTDSSTEEQPASPTFVANSRPRRVVIAPRQYEPETGQWV